ncbi:hypothetical protein GUJ93_ZPchr0013g33961 [Zizania palustris]|uniref:Uncharacterized protein n=1 Tax=Zizania palustris TaxID=103762 RepID=A0A8J5X306_ZIZPA|nr:hypothetical protein GUJ93_ZPchr0013g33961 [Zizania palustris]
MPSVAKAWRFACAEDTAGLRAACFAGGEDAAGARAGSAKVAKAAHFTVVRSAELQKVPDPSRLQQCTQSQLRVAPAAKQA